MTDTRSIESFPEEAQAYIRELRSEAAQYRTERNDLRAEATELREKYTEAGSLLKTANEQLAELSAAKDASEKNSADLAAAQEKLGRLTAAAKFKLPPEDAARLQGTSEEEWVKDAEALAARLKTNGVPRNDALGEGTPENENQQSDPVSEAFRAAGLL